MSDKYFFFALLWHEFQLFLAFKTGSKARSIYTFLSDVQLAIKYQNNFAENEEGDRWVWLSEVHPMRRKNESDKDILITW